MSFQARLMPQALVLRSREGGCWQFSSSGAAVGCDALLSAPLPVCAVQEHRLLPAGDAACRAEVSCCLLVAMPHAMALRRPRGPPSEPVFLRPVFSTSQPSIGDILAVFLGPPSPFPSPQWVARRHAPCILSTSSLAGLSIEILSIQRVND